MHETFDLSKLLKGYVRVWNEAGQIVEGRNLVVYNGGDIIAKLLSGDISYKIAYMYFGYENGAPAPVAANRADTTTFFSGMVPPKDYLRFPILQPVTLTASDANHLYNRATFVSTGNALAGVNGLAFGVGSGSQVFTVGLVASPTGLVAGDILYARYVLPVALPAAGSGQVSATWATEAD